jgi:hypothetical protein
MAQMESPRNRGRDGRAAALAMQQNASARAEGSPAQSIALTGETRPKSVVIFALTTDYSPERNRKLIQKGRVRQVVMQVSNQGRGRSVLREDFD